MTSHRYIFRMILASITVGSSQISGYIAADEKPGASELHAHFSGQGIEVLEGEQPVLFYQSAPKSIDGKFERANYVHPLHNLDGDIITEDFPDDHLHHRGIFWTWHQVWVGDQRIGDPWICQSFEWDVRSRGIELRTDGSVKLSAAMDWKSPDFRDERGAKIPIVRERTSIAVYPATDAYRLIDFEIGLRALVPGVKIGGSEDDKGYGGFSPRIQLNPEQIFTSEAGVLEPAKTAIDAGPWLDISGKKSGITILSHPSNPGHPQSWILRRARSMQNAVYPGREPVAVSMTEPTVLKYRLVLHRGDMEAKALSEIHAQYGEL